MKNGVEYLAQHPGWKSKRKNSAAKSKRRYRYDDGNTHTDNLTLAAAQKFQRMQNGGAITPMDRVVKSEGQKWIKTDVAQRALAFINSACNHDEVINQDKSIGAAVRTLQDGLRGGSSSDTVVAPSGKRITKEVAEARAGLIPESDWERQEEEETNVAAVKLSADDWVEIYYALEDKLNSSAVKGDARWKRHLRAIKETIGPDGELAAKSDYFDKSELATVLAALWMFQEEYDGKDADVIREEWSEHFTDADGSDIEPLGTDDISNLCERINCGD